MMLPTDAELVDAAAATYDPASVPFIADIGSALRIFLTQRADGLVIVSIEGTHDAVGWAFDFFALRIKDHPGIAHPSLGFIHAGFYTMASIVLDRLTAELEHRGVPYAICGHSLGAALALLLGAMLIVRGMPPVKIGAFAPPRVGGAKFVATATSVPFCAERYGLDPVPAVPLDLPIVFPYDQVPLRELQAPPLPRDASLAALFDQHHITNYVAGVHALS
jgi:hypothetical protein